ncbi:MAG: DUF3667 domain-containing protein [Planctomycetales bacterium]|nr:DUF3667 domain-containing protein [Planctomycetales bacterium]
MYELTVEALKTFIQIDSKFLLSLRSLIFHPGQLTKDYIQGRRQRYLRPLSLFLLIAALMFVVAEWQVSKRVKLSDVTTARGESVMIELLPGMNLSLRRESLESIERNPDEGIRSLLRSQDISPGTWQHYLAERALRVIDRDGINSFRQHMIRSASRAVFFLVPILAIVVYVFHLRQKVYLAESVIYCLHWHCFLFLEMTLQLLVPSVLRSTLPFFLIMLTIWYTARSMQTTFGDHGWIAWCKTIAILLTHTLFVGIASGLLALLVIASA